MKVERQNTGGPCSLTTSLDFPARGGLVGLVRTFYFLAVLTMLLTAPGSGRGAESASPGASRPERSRGIWFWGKPASPHGAVNVVGNPSAEAEALDTFGRWKIGRVYGSYTALPVERASALAAWNRQLHGAGIRSAFLFSDNGAIAESGRQNLLRLVNERVLQFNVRCAENAERFDEIALDVEPHATESWKSATPADRREMLEGLLTTCAALRRWLDDHDAKPMTISVALAYWLDRLPPEGRVGWKSAADRDDWFARLGRSVTSISPMAYERSKPEAILEATAWERAHFPGRTITALRARLGVEWTTVNDLQRAITALETAGVRDIDIENYELVRVAEAGR